MAPLPTLYVRQSIASGVDLFDGRSVPAEAETSHLVTLEARGIPGLTPDAIQSLIGLGTGRNPGRPSRPPVIYDVRPAPMIHDPAVDLTPGRVPMGQVGPPGSSFFETHKTKIMIGAGVLVIAAAGWFGFKWWKKKKAAAAEE
ncbi:hypothetical protein NXS19_009369 [Fusarium pseudograminearum]|nr:hypothetical protein NXS19_009369 [Fusarium pseudograminearum]